MSVQEAFKRAVDLLPEEPVVVEVGSHVGDGVKYMLEHRPKATIYAIEPYQRSFMKLQRFHKNSFPVAISDSDGECGFAEEGNSRQYRVSKRGSNVVPQMTLDGFIESTGISKIDLLRFDCYGSEYKIFTAPRRFLDVSGMVCITMHKKKVCKGVDIRGCRNFIKTCLENTGFSLVCSYGKGEKKHIFQLWKKSCPK